MRYERDMRGYGANPPDPKWPGGAKLAVSFVVNLEEGAEDSFEDGQPVNDKLGEFHTILPDGMRDLAIEQFHEYGLRAGVWRVLDLFDRYERKVTFYMCGRAVERSPQIAAEIVARGHEPASHGYRWFCHARFTDYEEEKSQLQKANDAIEKATGQRPYGFYSMWAPSLNTRSILKELGERGLIEREVDQQDKRRSIIAITDAGCALVNRTAEQTRVLVEGYRQAFGRERLARLMEELAAFHAALVALEKDEAARDDG